MESPKRLFLVDGSHMAFRAFFAVPRLTAPDGFPTNALLGFTKMLMKILREEKPDCMAVVFDSPEKSFREGIFPEYKGHRPEAPDDLKAQFPLFEGIVRGLNLAFLQVPGLEADDVIASLAERAKSSGMEVSIVSGDKDLMQVVGDGVRMLDTLKEKAYGPEEVKEKMGVSPERIPDLLALMGDASDNIPGVKGIGAKGAVRLLERFGSIEGIYERIGEVAGRQRALLEEGKDSAFLSKRLALLKRDAELPMSFHEMAVNPPRADLLRPLFERLAFMSLLRELGMDPLPGLPFPVEQKR